MDPFTNYTNETDEYSSYDIDYPIGFENSFNLRVLIPLALFCFIGILGNLCFCVAVFLDRSLRKQRSNILLLLMAIGDIVVIITRYLDTLYLESKYIRSWPWGATMCYLRYAIPVFAQALCIFSLTACSVERYLGVVKFPMNRTSKMSLFTVVSVILIIIVSTVVAGFSYWWAKYDYEYESCIIKPRNNELYKWFLVTRFIVIYIAPLIIVSYCYISIAKRIFHSSSLLTEDDEFQLGVRRSMARRKKGIVVLLLITLSFAVLWLPYHVHQLRIEFYIAYRADIPPHFDFTKDLFHYSSVANSVLDPVLIFLLSSEHRKAAWRMLTCKTTCGGWRTQLKKHTPPASSSRHTISSSSGKKINCTNAGTTNL